MNFNEIVPVGRQVHILQGLGSVRSTTAMEPITGSTSKCSDPFMRSGNACILGESGSRSLPAFLNSPAALRMPRSKNFYQSRLQVLYLNYVESLEDPRRVYGEVG